MSDRLKGKIIVVTGAGTKGEGIGNGKASAVQFAREGAQVLCSDLDEAAARTTADIIRDEGGIAEICVEYCVGKAPAECQLCIFQGSGRFINPIYCRSISSLQYQGQCPFVGVHRYPFGQTCLGEGKNS